jgi:butyryl-CoA dehydrogenase
MDYINQDDLKFLLFDWLKVEELTNRAEFADHDRETMQSVLDLAAQLSRETFAQHYKISDQQEPHLVDGKVVLPKETGEDIAAYREAGFFSASFPTERGGMGLPMTVTMATFANFNAANCGTAGYPFLTQGNANLMLAFGTEKQIETWTLPAIEGRFFGTMCLSEPQAGSSLGDIRTRAEPEGEDALGVRYRLRGNKMWISGGDQEMSENIVHLVLAKVPGEDGQLTPGVKGISIFAVPKYLPDGTRNDVAVAGLNHKMGFRGTSNCLLNFGENDGAIGWRIGEIGQGLPIMFHMMNEARIGVGMGAASMAYRGYVQSADYARERTQGRTMDGKAKAASPMVPIIEHTDVKRMLLAQKAYAEGALALCLYSAFLQDDINTHPDQARREDAAQLLDLLTPVTKSWPSEFGLVANELAIQVHGGYGYTRDYDVEQIYRDNRLNPIHEGTFGIQSIDLIGRKLGQKGGAGYRLLMAEIMQTIAAAQQDDTLAQEIAHLQSAVDAMQHAVGAVAAMGPVPAALDNSGAFLSAFGHVVVGWLWVSQALAAKGDSRLARGKQAACRYFLRVELPKAITGFAQVARAETCIAETEADIL